MSEDEAIRDIMEGFEWVPGAILGDFRELCRGLCGFQGTYIGISKKFHGTQRILSEFQRRFMCPHWIFNSFWRFL